MLKAIAYSFAIRIFTFPIIIDLYLYRNLNLLSSEENVHLAESREIGLGMFSSRQSVMEELRSPNSSVLALLNCRLSIPTEYVTTKIRLRVLGFSDHEKYIVLLFTITSPASLR